MVVEVGWGVRVLGRQAERQTQRDRRVERRTVLLRRWGCGAEGDGNTLRGRRLLVNEWMVLSSPWCQS